MDTPSRNLEADAGQPTTESAMPADQGASCWRHNRAGPPPFIGGQPPERLRCVEFYPQPDGSVVMAMRGDAAYQDFVVTPYDMCRLAIQLSRVSGSLAAR